MSDLISRQAVLEVISRECHELRGVYVDIEQAINKLPSADKTQMVDKSNFDLNQYKADLETAHDCGETKWLKCIEDIKTEIEEQIKTYVGSYSDTIIAYGLKIALDIIDKYRKVD